MASAPPCATSGWVRRSRSLSDSGLSYCGKADIGETKKGDLAQLRVYKFHSQEQLYLLGYARDDEIHLIYLEAAVPHENCYRDLKR